MQWPRGGLAATNSESCPLEGTRCPEQPAVTDRAAPNSHPDCCQQGHSRTAGSQCHTEGHPEAIPALQSSQVVFSTVAVWIQVNSAPQAHRRQRKMAISLEPWKHGRDTTPKHRVLQNCKTNQPTLTLRCPTHQKPSFGHAVTAGYQRS